MKSKFTTGLSGGLLVFFVLFCGYSQAQEAPRRLRGTIERMDGDHIVMKARDGAELTLKLSKNSTVVAIVKASLADIKSGLYVGVTGLPQPDGTQRAVEVHIFPESMRGVGEGHRPWDTSPGSTMTNGSVEQQVASVDGKNLKMKYKDGEKSISVVPDTQIVTYQPGDLADLKPGTKIFVNGAVKQPDGSFEVSRMNYGKDGIAPPM